MRLHESCPCGAEFDMTASWASEAAREVLLFRAHHAGCLVRSDSPVSTVSPVPSGVETVDSRVPESTDTTGPSTPVGEAAVGPFTSEAAASGTPTREEGEA